MQVCGDRRSETEQKVKPIFQFMCFRRITCNSIPLPTAIYMEIKMIKFKSKNVAQTAVTFPSYKQSCKHLYS